MLHVLAEVAINKPKLSLAMIVKDEEAHLERCLASAAKIADEMVVVDTGSTDSTVEIARRFGARIFSYEWTGDFGAARNFAIEQAQGEWILIMDADEEIALEDLGRLAGILDRGTAPGYQFPVIIPQDMSEQRTIENLSLRLFRNLPGHRYVGRIHEQVTIDWAKVAYADVHIRHVRQYAGRQDREQRIEIMLEALSERPGDSYLRYCLASELASQKRLDEALGHFEEGWRLLPVSRPAYGALLAVERATTLHRAGKNAEALAFLPEAQAHYGDHPELPLLEGSLFLAEGDYSSALLAFERARDIGPVPDYYPKKSGVGPWLAWRGIGACQLRLGKPELAISALEHSLQDQSGDPSALQLLREAHAGLHLRAAGGGTAPTTGRKKKRESPHLLPKPKGKRKAGR